MQEFGRILIISGLSLAAVGVLLLLAVKFGIPRLPGDIFIQKGGVRIYIPLAASLLISIVLSLVLWLWRK